MSRIQLEYWNEIGPTKSFAHLIDLERLRLWISPDSRILDYGCGYGRALGILHANGYRNLLGVDPAAAMIASACVRYPGIALQVLDEFPNVPAPAASFDAVLLIAVLTCIPASDAQSALIAEIARVLRPGGLLYISDMYLQTDERNLARYARDERKYGTYGVFDLDEGVTVRHHDRAWIESLLKEFEVLAVHDIDIRTMNGNPSLAFQWFGRRMDHF